MSRIPVMPMLALPGELPPGEGWAYEFKWRGARAITWIGDGRARLFSGSGADVTSAYPELAGLAGLARQAVVDGEIVATDAAGVPSRAEVAARAQVRDPIRAARLAGVRPVMYMIFDLLWLDGVDWTGRPYAHRRAALAWLTRGGDHWLVPPCFADGPATLAAAVGHHLDGIIAKRLDAPYRPGQRTPAWVSVERSVPRPCIVPARSPGPGLSPEHPADRGRGGAGCDPVVGTPVSVGRDSNGASAATSTGGVEPPRRRARRAGVARADRAAGAVDA